MSKSFVDDKVVDSRALQLRREAQMVSTAMGAAMIGTMYFLRANCVQHGGSASGGGLISASPLKLQGSSGFLHGISDAKFRWPVSISGASRMLMCTVLEPRNIVERR